MCLRAEGCCGLNNTSAGDGYVASARDERKHIQPNRAESGGGNNNNEHVCRDAAARQHRPRASPQARRKTSPIFLQKKNFHSTPGFKTHFSYFGSFVVFSARRFYDTLSSRVASTTSNT